MYSLKSNVLMTILCALAAVIVVYSSVYLSIDACASLGANAHQIVSSGMTKFGCDLAGCPRFIGSPPFQHPLQMLLIFLSTFESSEPSIRMASSPCIGGP
jgi:hypothetical protein